MTAHRTLLPAGWPRPKGYANGIAAQGTMVFTGGLVGWTHEEKFEAKDMAGQVRQILENLRAILAEAGGGPEHVVRMTWFVTDRSAYIAGLPEIGAAYRELMGRNFPAMSVVEVTALVEPEAVVEIEVTAVV